MNREDIKTEIESQFGINNVPSDLLLIENFKDVDGIITNIIIPAIMV
ncbi:MAG: hypothetical protein HFI75_10680 [Lachnospiraceae bacterium]|nr:hypothetical protein [Lachnospiraceae bacterium]